MFLIAFAALGQQGSNPYAPLRVYQGTWQVTHSGGAAATKPYTLVDQCAELGKYYACGQTVNGSAGSLIIFITHGANRFVTQTIMPDGRAGGEVILDLSGDTWTYSSRRDEYGKTTFYRNVNVFTGRTKIHYVNEHSADQKNWTVDEEGDEVKTR